MTVAELIEELKSLPGYYHVVFESGDAYGSAYYASVGDIEVNHKYEEVELKEL